MRAHLKRILLAEDSANDAELTLAALDDHHLANEVVLVRDGAEALDYLYARGAFAGRPDGNRMGVNSYVVKPVDFAEFMDAVRRIGGFWAVVNEPPPVTPTA